MTRQTQTTATSAPALGTLTGFLLRRAYVRTLEHARASLDPDANLRDAAILMVLEERDTISQREVADLVGANRTVMVKLADALEAGGYLARGRNPADRRAYALTITTKGRRRRKRLMVEFDAAESELTGPLSTDEQGRLKRQLTRLLDGPALETLPALHDYTGYLITLAHEQQVARAEQALAPLGIRPRDFGVMAVIDRKSPCSQQQVAEALGVSPPAALWLVDDLERDDLALRTRDASDRRSYDLTLTPHGRRTMAEAICIVASGQAEVVERLGVRGDRELRRLLTRIVYA